MKHEYDSLKCVDGFFFISDAGASINTPNIGNSTLIIEELDWGGQDTLNTCENSFFWTSFGPWKAKKRGHTRTNP